MDAQMGLCKKQEFFLSAVLIDFAKQNQSKRYSKKSILPLKAAEYL